MNHTTRHARKLADTVAAAEQSRYPTAYRAGGVFRDDVAEGFSYVHSARWLPVCGCSGRFAPDPARERGFAGILLNALVECCGLPASRGNVE